MEAQETSQENKSLYDKYYKFLMLIPVIVVLFSSVYLFLFYAKHQDIMLKDTTLSGGTTITVLSDVGDSKVKILKDEFSDLVVRKLTDSKTGEIIASIFESSVESEFLKSRIEKTLGYNLTNENSSVEFSGSALGEGFYKQLITAMVLAFLLMAIVVFVLFRTFIPSIAVIFAAFSDILVPLAVVNYFEIRLSAAGIAAFLMLIGYSVDTNLLLTTRAIKNREGMLNSRIYHAFKTGILMTLTSILAVLPAFFIVTGLPDSFRQIFLILAIGLFADIANTWFLNAGLIKLYCEKKGIT